MPTQHMKASKLRKTLLQQYRTSSETKNAYVIASQVHVTNSENDINTKQIIQQSKKNYDMTCHWLISLPLATEISLWFRLGYGMIRGRAVGHWTLLLGHPEANFSKTFGLAKVMLSPIVTTVGAESQKMGDLFNEKKRKRLA